MSVSFCPWIKIQFTLGHSQYSQIKKYTSCVEFEVKRLDIAYTISEVGKPFIYHKQDQRWPMQLVWLVSLCFIE